MFRWIHVYENPETSEVAGSFTTLKEALTHPPKPEAEVICNGKVLARVVEGSWELTEDGVNGAWVHP